MTREEAEEIIIELNPKAYFLDGFDDAIIGVGGRPTLTPIIVYNQEKIIEKLMSDMEPDEIDLDGRDIDDVKLEMAIDYFDFNIKHTWVGEGTPLIVETKYN
jgi:hypothetical protein